MKSNPSKQDLIDFINQTTSKDIESIKKIQDLSTGTHYLLLLHQIYPSIVKMSKINIKAFQQYESINNLKLLAIYISELKASFTFQLTKIAQKSYQDNLNLVKNLYKLYHETITKRQNQKEKEESQNVKQSQKAEPEHRNNKSSLDTKNNLKSKPKIVLKGPPVIKKQMKKISVQKDYNENMMKQMSEPIEKIKKIIKIIQSNKQTKETAQVKIIKIKQVLNDKIKQSNNTNFSVKCSGSKSVRKQSNEFEIDYPKLPVDQNFTKTEGKNLNGNQNTENQFNTELKKLPSTFNCEQLKQSMFKKYELRPTSARKKSQENRKSCGKQQLNAWIKQEQEDTREVENLLSPKTEQVAKQSTSSKRKSIIRRNSQNILSLSKRKSTSVNGLVTSMKSVHFSPKRISQRQSELNSSQKSVPKKKQSETKRQQTQNSKSKSVRG